MSYKQTRSKTMKQKLIRLMPLFLISMLFLSTFASAETQVAIPQSEQSNLKKVITAVGGVTIDNKDGTKGKNPFELKSNALIFNEKEFEKANSKSQQEIIRTLNSSFEANSISKKTRRDISKAVQDSSPAANRLQVALVLDDSSADMSGGYAVLSGAMPLVKVAFGVLVYVILYGLIFSTILDLMYLTIPFLRNIGANGGEKPVWVSPDAYNSVKESESGDKASNVYGKYIIKRSFAYILLVLTITFLVVGNMGGLIASLMTLGDGLLSL